MYEPCKAPPFLASCWLFALLFVHAISFSQTKRVALLDKVDKNPFLIGTHFGRPVRNFNTENFDKKFIHFDISVLKLLDSSQYSLFFAKTKKKLPVVDKSVELYFLVGLDVNNKLHLVIDTNFNKEFLDDKEYIFPATKKEFEDSLAKHSMLTDLEVNLSRFNINKRVHLTVVPFRLSPFVLKSNNPFADTTRFAFEATGYKFGTLIVNSKPIFIYAYNSSAGINYKDNKETRVIISDTIILGTLKREDKILKIGDSSVINGEILKIENISNWGDSITITLLGKVKKTFYTQNIKILSGKTDIITAKPITSSFLKDKTTLLDFWGTWCGPCVGLTDTIKALYKNFISPRKDHFALIGVALDDSIGASKKYLENKEVPWLNIFQQANGSQPVINKFKVSTYPTFILLNAKGEIIARETGVAGFYKVAQLLARTSTW